MHIDVRVKNDHIYTLYGSQPSVMYNLGNSWLEFNDPVLYYSVMLSTLVIGIIEEKIHYHLPTIANS